MTATSPFQAIAPEKFAPRIAPDEVEGGPNSLTKTIRWARDGRNPRLFFPVGMPHDTPLFLRSSNVKTQMA